MDGRTNQIRIRLSDVEKSIIKKHADAEYRSMSDYLRLLGLKIK